MLVLWVTSGNNLVNNWYHFNHLKVAIFLFRKRWQVLNGWETRQTNYSNQTKLFCLPLRRLLVRILLLSKYFSIYLIHIFCHNQEYFTYVTAANNCLRGDQPERREKLMTVLRHPAGLPKSDQTFLVPCWNTNHSSGDSSILHMIHCWKLIVNIQWPLVCSLTHTNELFQDKPKYSQSTILTNISLIRWGPKNLFHV